MTVASVYKKQYSTREKYKWRKWGVIESFLGKEEEHETWGESKSNAQEQDHILHSPWLYDYN